MSLSWPWALLALLVIPLVSAVWWLTRRRRRRAVVRVSSIALVRTAVPGRSRWQRRIPAALLMLGLAVLAIGAARPQATVPVASSSATIMLALDVSGSMCSTDVKPNRITAAERAASAFIRSQAGGPRIGLVTFAGTAVVLVPPTADTQQLLSALDGLTTSFGTAIGEGILTSLDAIAQVDPSGGAPRPPPPPRPGRPVGRADRRDRPPRRRLRRRRDRRAHRRLEQPGRRPADRGEGGRRPRRARLHDRLRYR
jgi:Ca-activated chloride channel family protein